MSKDDPIASLMEKIVWAVVMLLVLIFFVPVALGMFGLFQCNGCDAITALFSIGFIPIATVFIIIYFILKQFASSD